MPSTIDPAQLGNTLIEFSSNGEFPDEQISASLVDTAALPTAVEALNQTKLSLEVCMGSMHEFMRLLTS
jgi:hypothetical protein